MSALAEAGAGIHVLHVLPQESDGTQWVPANRLPEGREHGIIRP